MLPLLPTKGGEACEGLETHPANLPSSIIVSKEQKHSGKRLCCDVTTSGCREVQGADLWITHSDSTVWRKTAGNTNFSAETVKEKKHCKRSGLQQNTHFTKLVWIKWLDLAGWFLNSQKQIFNVILVNLLNMRLSVHLLRPNSVEKLSTNEVFLTRFVHFPWKLDIWLIYLQVDLKCWIHSDSNCLLTTSPSKHHSTQCRSKDFQVRHL